MPRCGKFGRPGVALAVLALSGALAAQQAAPPGRPPRLSTRQQAPPTRIVSGVTVVDVPILVLNNQGQPIQNLTLDDFTLHDDYKLQRLTGLDSQARPVSLAVVVDTSDRASLVQAQRAAQVIADMIMGATGEAAVFIPGPEAKEVEPFSRDANLLVATIRHLKLTPSGSDITAPLEMAAARLRTRPRGRARAILVITRQNTKQGTFSSALLEAAMNEAMPVFRVYPDQPSQPPPPDPLNPATNGAGVGSSRQPMPVMPVGAHGQLPAEGNDQLLNLGAIAAAVHTMLRSRSFSYVYTTGGVDLRAANDGDFDRKLSEIGNLLRSTYHLYYQPNDLTAGPAMHLITVRVSKDTGVAKTTYRHTYIGMQRP